MSNKQTVNIFTELNSDSHNINTQPNVMTDALNATLTTKGENQLILQNMTGNENITGLTPGYQPLGVQVYDGISYIISGKFDTEGNFESGEIGTFPSPRWGSLLTNGIDPDYFLTLQNIYSPLKNFCLSSNDTFLNDDRNYISPFRTSKLNFLSDRLIEIECQPSYDGSVNIIFTDDYNRPRLVNSRFKLSSDRKSAAIADRRQVKDTNTYSDKRFLSTQLIKTTDKIPDLNFNGVITGGKLTGGGYKAYFTYQDADGATTDIIEESSLVAIGYDNYGARTDEETGKAIKFTLGNLDRSFSAIKVYLSYSSSADVSGVSTIYEINDIYDIPSLGDIEILITGYESKSEISRDQLNLDYSSIHRVKTMSQNDDQLVLGNIASNLENYEEFARLAQGITIGESFESIQVEAEGSGYADPNNVYYKLGYWAGETYELGIVFILPEGRGLTPVMPIRGGDNYNNDFNYTGTSEITDSNGYIAGTSENRLGAYRTYKQRDLLTDGGNSVVKYFTADMRAIAADAALISDGFFFVRRERRKDAIEQGYICNTLALDLGTANVDDVQANGDQDYFSTALNGDLEFDFDHYRPLRDLSGSYSNKPKLVPAPGRIWASTVISVEDPTNTLLTKVKGDSFNTQGKVYPDPTVYSNRPYYYSYYSADHLCDAPTAASRYNGSRKGMVINYTGNTVIARNIFNPGLSAVVSPGNTIYTGSIDYTSGYQNNPSTIVVGLRTIKVHAESFNLTYNPNTNTYSGTIVFMIEKNSSNRYYVTMDVQISNFGNITGSSAISAGPLNEIYDGSQGNSEAYISNTGSISGYLNGNPDTGTFSFTSFTIETHSNSASGNQYTVDFSSTGDRIIDIPTSAVLVTPPTDSVITLSGNPSIEPIKVLTLDPILFAPEEGFISRDYPVSGYYIPEDKNAYSVNDFSAVGSNNYFQYLNNQQINGVENTSIRTNAALMTVDSCNFSDYVGFKMKNGSNLIGEQLRNDKLNVFNERLFANNSYGLTGRDDTDYTYKLQIEGIRFAVVCNIYNSINGPISTNDWSTVYSNTGILDSYRQITKRTSWSDLTHPEFFDIYGGDCYMSYTYKRVVKPLGIEGVPTASDITAYETNNKDAGLAPKGFVFPLAHQCNYNPALRTTEDKFITDEALYGKERDFYPLTDIDTIRESQQTESKGYNFGYNFASDRYHLSLNDRSPIFNDNYSNRVMVSSPSSSGSFKNGYTDFSGLNFRDYNSQLGEITRLITHNNQIYCIFEKGIGVVPMNQRTMVSEQSGGVFLDDVQVLAQKMLILSSEYGSDQQFSIIKTDGYVYGVDLQKNKVWRIESTGVVIISDFAIQSILNIYKNRLKNNNMKDVVKANYDRERNNVIFSYFSLFNGKYNTDLYVSDYTEPETGGSTDPIITQQDQGKFDSSIVSTPPTTGGDTDVILDAEIEREAVTRSRQLISREEFSTSLPLDDLLVDGVTGEVLPELLESNKLGSIYFNETINKWVSQLSWNPLFTWNLGSKLFSFNALNNLSTDPIWEHFSPNVPYCNFYGSQDKFEFEFVVVDNASVQKILNNLLFICNRSFPNNLKYTIDTNVDFDSYTSTNSSYVDKLKQRHEFVETSTTELVYWTMNTSSNGTNSYIDFGISVEEAERISGGYFVYNNNFYILGQHIVVSDVVYVEILDQIGNSIPNLPAGITFNSIEFGIIKQNMEYKEDHLYIEVGKGFERSRIRDKAIKIRVVYEGMYYTTVQSIISMITYSHN